MRWHESTLGQIVKCGGGLIQTGPFGSQLHQADYISDDGVPVVMPKDIVDGRVSLETIARVSEETANRLERHKLLSGTILIPRRGDVTKRAFIKEEYEGWLCGTGCLKVELSGKILAPEFLYYFMEQGHVVQWLLQNAVGTTMLNLSAAILSQLPIHYPFVEGQRRIAAILSSYDDAIQNNLRRIELLEKAARQVYQEWFVRLRFPGYEHTRIRDRVPEGWEQKRLGDICFDLREAVSPEVLEPDTPYIGLEHMPRRSISLSEWGRADEVTSTKLKFSAGDIIFGKIRPYFHKVGVAFVDGVASSDAIVICPVEERLRSLLLMTVSSDPFIAVTSQAMKEGSKMPRADWKQMKEYPVALPPEGLLKTFNEIVGPVVEQLKNLTFQNQKLRSARDLLLPKLMSGEISV